MAVQRFAGFVYTGAGVAVVGATVDIFTRNTLTAAVTVPAAITTDANGYYSATVAAEGRYDVRITNGSSVSWLKYDDEIQITTIEVATLRVRNPASTFDYDIVPAAITADRQLNLPLITATDTIATLGLAQTFSAALTFSAAGTALTVDNNARIASLGVGIAPPGTAGYAQATRLGLGVAPGNTTGTLFELTGTVSLTADVNTVYINPTATSTQGTDTGQRTIGVWLSPTVQTGIAVGNSLGQANRVMSLLVVEGVLQLTGAGTVATGSGATFIAPTLTLGTGAMTNATTVRITGAPTLATNNYAFWVQGGGVRLDGARLDINSLNMSWPGAMGAAGTQLQTDGASPAVLSWAAAGSLEEWKYLERLWDKPQDALARMIETPVWDFHYRPDAKVSTQDFETLYTGPTAADAPWAMHHQNIVNPVNALGFMILGFQALEQEFKELQQELAILKGR